MMEFSINPKIYFGSNSIEYVSKLKGKKAFIVTDPFMLTTDYVNKISSLLKNSNIKIKIFSHIKPDPSIDIINEGVKSMIDFSPDIIIALGGGSTIDSAKSICVFSNAIMKAYKNDNKTLFIAIPTTSGTGSEVTAFSVITDKESHKKYPLYDESLTPDVAIIDPNLVKSVPKSITADTGLDVLTHAIEAYVSKGASDYSDALAEKAIKLVFKYLPRVYKNGEDLEGRAKMHNACCIAGMAFNNAYLGLNHGMAHALGAKFHISHGRANAILLPYVVQYNADMDKGTNTLAAKKYREIAKMLYLPSATVEMGVFNLVEEIKKLINELDIPSPYKMGIDKTSYLSGIYSMSKMALKDKCTATNPKKVELEEITKLFKKVYGN